MANITKREFLAWMAISGLTVDRGIQFLKEKKQENIIKQIYNLNKNTHKATFDGEVFGENYSIEGMGIFLNDYFISVAHIPYEEIILQNLNNPETKIIMEIKNRTAKIGNINLEELTCDPIQKGGTDVYIAKPDKKITNFPCKPNINVSLGEKVYIIGNPKLNGPIIRPAYISDLNGFFKNPEPTENTFGISEHLIGGDSGCPVVNEKFELLGLCDYAVNGFGYINKIELYLDAMESIRRRTRLEPSKKEEGVITINSYPYKVINKRTH